jgi:hypothetical protein
VAVRICSVRWLGVPSGWGLGGQVGAAMGRHGTGLKASLPNAPARLDWSDPSGIRKGKRARAGRLGVQGGLARIVSR